jgi:hypothetical protein
MINGLSRALLCTAILVPALSHAQQSAPRPQSPEFSYSYVELAYDESDFDLGPADIDGDGLTLAGSFELNDEWHVYASYGTFDLDFGLDLDSWALGGGYVFPLQENIDLYGRVLYIDSEVDAGPGNASEDGLGLQVRIRARMSEVFELEGGIQHVDVFDSDTSLQGFARYHFTEEFSAALGLTMGGDADSIGISARYSF